MVSDVNYYIKFANRACCELLSREAVEIQDANFFSTFSQPGSTQPIHRALSAPLRERVIDGQRAVRYLREQHASNVLAPPRGRPHPFGAAAAFAGEQYF